MQSDTAAARNAPVHKERRPRAKHGRRRGHRVCQRHARRDAHRAQQRLRAAAARSGRAWGPAACRDPSMPGELCVLGREEGEVAAWHASGSPGVRAPCSRTITTDTSSTVVTAPPHHSRHFTGLLAHAKAYPDWHPVQDTLQKCPGDGLTAACDKAQHAPKNGLPPLRSTGLRRQQHVVS